MRFNACNPCCTNLPAWTVYHEEVPAGKHVIQVAAVLNALNNSEINPATGQPGVYKTTSYISYLFFTKETTDDDGNTIWTFKNCSAVEGKCSATLNLVLTDKNATGKCKEQTWIKAAYVKDFEYIDSEGVQESGKYSTYKFKFAEGKFVSTCCHLVDVVNHNYLNLSGNLGLVDDSWRVEDYDKTNSKPNPFFWFTMILCPKAGSPNYQKGICTDPIGNTVEAYVDAPIGDFNVGAANPGSFWMVGTTPPNSVTPGDYPDIENYDYNKQAPTGFYLNRWSLNTFGLSCGFKGATSNCPPINLNAGFNLTCPDSCIVGWNSAFASVQTNPLYLDAACGYGYWFDGFLYYNYWPWQSYWGYQLGGLGGGGFGYTYPAYFGWGSWNYGWWWNMCELGNPGPYFAQNYGYWWGGPFYAGGLGGTWWNWWGVYPCYNYIAQPYCWWWGYGYDGWWGIFGWWWWGYASPYNYLGDWVDNVNKPGAFDDWYKQLYNMGFENSTCQGYSKCNQYYNEATTPLKCYAKGERPITITMPVVYNGESGSVTMKGTVKIDSVAVSGTVYDYSIGKNMFEGCGIGSTFTGSLEVSGLVEGTCDVTLKYPHGTFLVDFDFAQDVASDISVNFFGGTVYTKKDGTKVSVPLLGTYTNIHQASYPYNSFSGSLSNTSDTKSFGDLSDGDLKLKVSMKVGKAGVKLIDSGMNFDDVDRFKFDSTLQGDTYYSPLFWKRQNCGYNIQCVPKHPVLGQVNMQHQDVEYAYVYQTEHFPGSPYVQCFLIDIIPNIHTYCYGLFYLDSTAEGHALDDLVGEDFIKVPNPPLNSYEELPWDSGSCDGDVHLEQLVTLVSDDCVPTTGGDDDLPTP